MMTQIFIFTVAVSVIMAVLIGLLGLGRSLTEKTIDYKVQYDFWRQIAVIALIAPFSLLMFGWSNALAEPELPSAAPFVMQEPQPLAPDNAALKTEATAEVVTEPPVFSQPQTPNWFGLLHSKALPVLAWGWLFVFMFLLLGRVIAYFGFRQKLEESSQPFDWQDIPLPETEIEQMRKSAPVLELRQQINPAAYKAPFLIGLLRPCLFLPEADSLAGFSKADWRNMLKHELTHYQRRDILSKWEMMLSKSLHWFNPAIYFAERQLEQECEISCDLEVTGDMNLEQRRDYMRTILHMIRPNACGLAVNRLYTGINDDKKQIQRRFEVISNYKISMGSLRRMLATFVIFLLLFAGSGSIVLAAKMVREELPLLTNSVNQVVVSNNGEPVNLQNKAMVTADGEIYLPLQEMLEQFGVITDGDGSLKYQDNEIQLNLQQWVSDAAGGRVLNNFYVRSINISQSDIPTFEQDGVVYVPARVLLEIAQMSAAGGGHAMQGLGLIQYNAVGGEILRIIALPLPAEDNVVNRPLLLDEKFAVVVQLAEAWHRGDYQAMQTFCCGEAIENVGWQYMDVMIGQAEAVMVWQLPDEPNTVVLQVLTKPLNGQSSFANRQLDVEVSQQADGRWLISKLNSSQHDLKDLSSLFAYSIGYNGHSLQWPTDSRVISAGFKEGESGHSGIDIVDTNGKPVYAVAAGRIIAAGYMGADGNKIILSHFSERDEWESRYSHLQSIAVKVGDEVQAGQVIGYIGSTGNSTGPHLHFSLLRNGQVLNPQTWLPQLKY